MALYYCTLLLPCGAREWVSTLRWVCSFPVTRRLGYLWAAVSQAAPPIREEQARGHHLFIQPGPNDVWAGCAQFEARRAPSILLKVVSLGSHWMRAPAGSGWTCSLHPWAWGWQSHHLLFPSCAYVVLMEHFKKHDECVSCFFFHFFKFWISFPQLRCEWYPVFWGFSPHSLTWGTEVRDNQLLLSLTSDRT